MPFERFIPPPASHCKPSATLRPSGLISFDANAVGTFDLKSASHLVLFFDSKRKLIGAAKTNNPRAAGATRVSRRRSSMSVKCPEFFQAYGLIVDEPKRLDVRLDSEHGMLTIDVSGIPRKRGRRPKIR